MKKTILLIMILLLNIKCNNNPVEVKQENREPVILSVTVFPEIVKPHDSLIVICNAYDPDGDTLVYDWITTGVVRIKGAFGDDFSLYNTYENSRIFYAPDSLHVSSPKDTFWVQCFARDRKGKSTAKIIHFTVIKDF
jgi:hypothetical protein